FPQRLKPRASCTGCGTAEAVAYKAKAKSKSAGKSACATEVRERGFAVVLRWQITNRMRYASRLGSSRRYVFLPVVVLIFSFVIGQTAHGQAPGASSPQSEQRVISPALPAAWNDGVKALAEKMAAVVKPSRAVSLEVRNISSLGAGDVDAVRRA